MTRPFRVSTGLKDLIGQGLITNDYVAVFELVKNSFDAHARTVKVVFLEDKLIIADDGKGMSHGDITGKWLFVAYSAKRDGTEDQDYRHDIGRRRRHVYAGAKGVGRFSCDRLGEKLTLHSRAEGHSVQVLTVDWTRYEEDAKREFSEIGLSLEEQDEFSESIAQYAGPTGTILEIQRLRSDWTRESLLGLRRELAKLINPFQSDSNDFNIVIDAPSEADRDKAELQNAKQKDTNTPVAAVESLPLINGPVTNPILDVLKEKTTSVLVEIEKDNVLTTRLYDRGDKIYQTRETNPYPGLTSASVEVEIYFLNRSAKYTFTRRMGLPSVQFGSIFLFRNGFRVFPIGDQEDDFFGLARRHQQGVRRFLGTRDLIGRVQIDGSEGFDETTSRDGLIRTPQVQELIDCVRDKCVRRLERYV
ncbi:MAG: ATP-binding protein, partial [Chloroflexota bacterium]|nr:ATP-binding protein [Chloroflexota bacterium]